MNIFLDPAFAIAALLLLAGGCKYFKKKLFLPAVLAALLVFVLTSTAPLPTWLITRLERQYTPLLHPRQQFPDAARPLIMVLGGGHVSDARLPYNDQLSDPALKRLVEGVRLYRELPGSKLVLSGFARAGIAHTQAQVLAQTALLLGVPASDTLLLNSPQNTMQEAQACRERFGKQQPLVVVTTAIHMPRAMMHFRRAGLHPVAAPTGFICKRDNLPRRPRLWPSARYMVWVQKALHEYLGTLHGQWAWRSVTPK